MSLLQQLKDSKHQSYDDLISQYMKMDYCKNLESKFNNMITESLILELAFSSVSTGAGTKKKVQMDCYIELLEVESQFNHNIVVY